MPLIDDAPHTHWYGCWRHRRHWQCAVGLVEKLAGVLREVHAQCGITPEGRITLTITPQLYSRIAAILGEVGR